MDFEVYKEPTIPHSATIFLSNVLKLTISDSSVTDAIKDLDNLLVHCENVLQFRNHLKVAAKKK